ncbi:MAG: hypothetical protein PWQ97_813 [Tepidanaerobacteraceae bacterium]|nr:hypothetical protein [Tepidanaerobacteraceae bacterium]
MLLILEFKKGRLEGCISVRYKDFFTVIIIFLFVMILGLRAAEAGVYSMMGIDKKPESFDFNFDFQNRVYDFSILGVHRQFALTVKVADFYADKKTVRIKFKGKDFTIHPLIEMGFVLKNTGNLDKKSTKMYN